MISLVALPGKVRGTYVRVLRQMQTQLKDFNKQRRSHDPLE
jgi:hypothetical protein